MAGLLSGILGGALQGLGEGMVKQAEQTGLEKREARLAELKHGYDKEMAGVNHGYRDAENAASSQRGLLNDEARERLKHTLKMEEDAASGTRTAAEKEKDRQFELRKAALSGGKPLTDNEILKIFIDLNTTYEPVPGSIGNPKPVVNRADLARDLRAYGREDLARVGTGSPDPYAWTEPSLAPEDRPSGPAVNRVGAATPTPVTPSPSQAGTPSSGQPPAAPPPAPQSAAPAQAGAPPGGPVRERFVRDPNGGKVVSESKLRGTP